MTIMKNMREWLEKWSTAVAFGEANDAKAVQEITGMPEPKDLRQTVEDWMTAAAFAEANAPEAAREALNVEEPIEDYLERKLGAVMLYGVAAVESVNDDLNIPGLNIWYGTAEVA